MSHWQTQPRDENGQFSFDGRSRGGSDSAIQAQIERRLLRAQNTLAKLTDQLEDLHAELSSERAAFNANPQVTDGQVSLARVQRRRAASLEKQIIRKEAQVRRQQVKVQQIQQELANF